MNNIGIKAADNIRALAVAMVEQAKSGHPGGAMGGADFMHVLFSEFLVFDPNDMSWSIRDRFFLDPGHMSAMLYGQLSLFGKYSMEDLHNFRQWGSPTPGHPERNLDRGVENTSGPLGLGQAFGIGAAVAERFLEARFGNSVAHHTYIYISDGGIQEEISQGTGRLAGHLGLGNVIMFYDANDIQLSTEVDVVTGEDTAKKYESWGWHVQTIAGNDQQAIKEALKTAKLEKNKPSLIIGKTTMGKGALTEAGQSYEGKIDTHGMPLSKTAASSSATLTNLGADPNIPFQIYADVKQEYNEIIDKKIQEAQQRKTAFAQWSEKNPELFAKWNKFMARDISGLQFYTIEHKANIASRSASGNVLAYLADHIENLIVSSADLSNSDKTDAFLKKTYAFSKGNFNGAFLQAGVSELSMAAMNIGMALHGGVIPVCATFFAFSDFMKPALRLAALMEIPCIFLWTHDAFRVGEDGPTHQPVEQEAQLRLLEHLFNHHGKRSFLALRPADSAETSVAWKMALENLATPTGLILSRQNIQDLPAFSASSRYESAKNAVKGAYILNEEVTDPDVILVANGSEVTTLVEGAGLLSEKQGLKVRLVSAPSEGRFRDQDKAYQQSVIPAGFPVFGLTAGLPITLQGLVGANGKVHGLSHFGYSAPYSVLDEKFGFTGENVYQQVCKLLGK